MHGNFKNIHIGKLIELRMRECDIGINRAAAFLKVSEGDIEQMYTQKYLNCEVANLQDKVYRLLG